MRAAVDVWYDWQPETRPAWMPGIVLVITSYMVMGMTRGSGGFLYFQF
jgi:hypothetical protein